MGAYSAAGTVEGWNAAAPKWVDLMPGYRYAICVANSTDADITTGTLTVEAADADPEDFCKPGPFTTLQVEPDCASPLGTQPQNAVITITAQSPIKAHSQCQFSFPCPKRFIRVSGAAGGLDITVVITGLKRTGMQDVDPATWPGGFHGGGWEPFAQAPHQEVEQAAEHTERRRAR